MFLLKSLFIFSLAAMSHSASLRGQASLEDAGDEAERRLAAPYYYSTSDPTILGAINVDVTAGNPMRGLHTSPRYTGGKTPNDTIVSTLEFYYIGLDEVMVGNNVFNWTALDKTLSDAEKRNNHVIWRVYIDFPGSPLRLPKYLIDAGLPLYPRSDGGQSPNYDHPLLETAFQQFVAALGARYDGHRSVFAIQLGLIGKWGEWHTYPENGLVSQAGMDKLANLYNAAFKTTQLEVRGPHVVALANGMGIHDDAFAHSTLGTASYFTWPKLKQLGKTDFWKVGVMGGETLPQLQGIIFEPTYVPGSPGYKQDFMECVNTTHATHMFHHGAFGRTPYSGAELDNARRAHARMGYNFVVSNVAVATAAPGRVSVDVTVTQIGVAPFYYPLSLALNCPGTKEMLGGVETLIDAGQGKLFTFASIPADSACLSNIKISLESPFLYTGRPIKFAQGNGNVVFSLPLPSGSAPVTPPVKPPTSAPVKPPTAAPVKPPTAAPAKPPTAAPVKPPTVAPVKPPTAAPVKPPTSAPAKPPTAAPVKLPTAAPVKPPTPAPVKPPTSAPVKPPTTAPVPSPTAFPVKPPTVAPVSVPAPVAAPISATPQFFVDARTGTGSRFTVTKSSTYSIAGSLAGLPGYQGDLFRHHRWASGGFTYTMSGFTPGVSYSVTMGFAETWSPACATSKRITDIFGNGLLIVPNLDVFAVAGCKKAHIVTKTVAASATGIIELKFAAVVSNPMVSFIDVKSM